ncbi:leucine-rich repeat domain-containing protein [Tenacibaculum sp. SDUM215027]|uniref:leucine-rich repeat domain-containing protein n=1 Tax=Tenacibaculum sp. SDUM215027 TaxID=3422596 RepID=UPI003D312945
MKTITPFCFATLFAFNIYSQETIRIPDIGLEECLINLKIDSNGLNGSITISDAEYVTNLNVNDPVTNKDLPNVYSKIKDLTGLESFPNLKRLDCFGNNIKKIDLSQSSSISFLNCSENKIERLDVSKNHNLTYISCDYNKLTSLILGENSNIQSLYASYNQLTALDVSNCPNLESMDVTGNKIKTIIVSDDQLANIPQGWYKDEKTIYATSSGAVADKKVVEEKIVVEEEAVIESTEDVKPETVKKPIKKYADSFIQIVVSEYEKSVLNETYLKQIKKELTHKYDIKDEELTEWIQQHSKLHKTE